MKNGGLYKNVTMSPKTANIMVLCAIGVLVFCFVFAVSTADKETGTEAEYNTGVYDRAE